MIGKTIGQYQVIDKIGEGGMGAVYKAEDTTLHRLVALKTLSGHLTEDEEAQERFVREAQAASSLNHPNITTVYEFLEDEDTRLICMEYVEGKTIRDMVESGVVSVRKAIDIIMQAAEALEAAHNKGILHRDVKSANIMVNMEGRVKVMDFGLAQLAGKSQLTRTGTTMGTLSYSSPEQISGKPVDKRSEIFSLGVVFYELLTGQLPFKATNEAEILFAIINNEPPKLSKVRDDVPELVEAVASRMLEKDADLRYQTCGEVISDLKGIRKEMETSTVGITGALERVRAGRRKSLIARLAIGCSVIAVITIAAFLLFPRRAELDPNRVVVALINNRTEDQSLNRMCDWASNSIRQSIDQTRLLEVVGHETVYEFYQILEAREERLEEASRLHQLADFTKAGTIIAGSLYELPEDEVEFQIEVIDMSTGESRSLTPVRGLRSDYTELVGTIQQHVLASLAAQLHPDFGQWAELTSPPVSLEAFSEFALGVQSYFKSQHAEALEHLYRAISLDSTFYNAYLWAARVNSTVRIDDFAATDSLLQIVEKSRDRLLPLESLLYESNYYFLRGDAPSVYEATKEGARLSPGGFWSYDTGQFAWWINRPKEALEYLEQVHPESPIRGWDAYYYNVLRALFDLERFDEIIDVSWITQQQFPDYSGGYNFEARALATLGRHDELESLINRCIDMFPTTGVFPSNVMMAAASGLRFSDQHDLSRQFADRAVQWLQSRPEEEKSSASYRNNLAFSYYYGEHWDEAEEMYSELNSEYPDNIAYLGFLGVLAARRDDRERAENISSRMAEIDLKYIYRAGLPYWRACIAAQLGDLENAIILLKESFELGKQYETGKYDIDLEPLFDMPAFKELIRPKG